MCGRVIQASPPDQLGLKIIDALDPRDNRVTGDPFGNVPPRYNGAPSQQLWVIRQNPQTGERSLDLLQWGLIPYWCKDKPKPPPINAKAETVDREDHRTRCRQLDAGRPRHRSFRAHQP